MRTTEQYDSGKMSAMSSSVTLSTVHGAKGREWKHVLIFADDNIAFPNLSNIGDCINNKVPDSDIISMIDEGRRLHYVGMTRAKDDLVIFTDCNNISIYALESFGCIGSRHSDLTIIENIKNSNTAVYKVYSDKFMSELNDKRITNIKNLDIDVSDMKSKEEQDKVV